jgi:hypothetical protein
MANSRLYEDLKKKIRGQVVVPGDADYEQRSPSHWVLRAVRTPERG